MLLNLKYFENVKFKKLYQIHSDYPKGILFRDITTLIKMKMFLQKQLI